MIRLVNIAISVICQANNWTFVENRNIDMDKISKFDGYHLSNEGASILTCNLYDILHELVCNVNFTLYVHSKYMQVYVAVQTT